VRAGSLAIAQPAPRPARLAVFATAGAFCGAFLIVAIAVLQGMSIATLLEGTLWGPLRQPGKFTRPLFLPPLAIPAAALIPLALAALHQFRTRSQAQLRLVAAVRFAVGAFTIALLMETPNAMVWALPFLPLGLIPVTGRGWKLSEWIPRIFIVAMATTEFLQGYPVAGSQMGAAALPLLLWAFIAMHDGLAGLSSHSGRASSVSAESFAWQPVIAGLIALVSITTRYGPAFWPPGYLDPPSHLRGSASLHLSSSAEHRYQQIAGNIRANCDSLFTMPGMGSLNLWSGVPAPNGLNTTGWMRTFSPEQQQQLLRLLQANTHGCAIYNADLAGFWGSPRASLDSLPLARYILYEMPEIAEVEGYEIHVHPNRPMPWLTAR
jgi:hypothetical protein